MRKALLFSSLIIALLGITQIAHAEPKLIAAKFHADWCGSCKTIAPTHNELISKFSSEDVLFITFDKTDEATSNQSMLLAQALGIDEVYKSNEKTGFILLIDPQTKEVQGKLTKTQSVDEMSTAVMNSIQ